MKTVHGYNSEASRAWRHALFANGSKAAAVFAASVLFLAIPSKIGDEAWLAFRVIMFLLVGPLSLYATLGSLRAYRKQSRSEKNERFEVDDDTVSWIASDGRLRAKFLLTDVLTVRLVARPAFFGETACRVLTKGGEVEFTDKIHGYKDLVALLRLHAKQPFATTCFRQPAGLTPYVLVLSAASLFLILVSEAALLNRKPDAPPAAAVAAVGLCTISVVCAYWVLARKRRQIRSARIEIHGGELVQFGASGEETARMALEDLPMAALTRRTIAPGKEQFAVTLGQRTLRWNTSFTDALELLAQMESLGLRVSPGEPETGPTLPPESQP